MRNVHGCAAGYPDRLADLLLFTGFPFEFLIGTVRTVVGHNALDHLFQAIVEDDGSLVTSLLKHEPPLATTPIQKPILYQEKIFHWIYAGDTALHLAAAGYRVEIIRQLFAAGADANVRGKHRHATPLHYAADGYINAAGWDGNRQVRVIQVLLAAGADINAQDKNGATPLHRAVRTRCAAAVRCLLDSGAEPGLKNKPGSTPFHLAVQNTGRGGSGADVAVAAQRKIIKEFLSFGVRAGIKTASGKTVRECAQSDWIRELLAPTRHHPR